MMHPWLIMLGKIKARKWITLYASFLGVKMIEEYHQKLQSYQCIYQDKHDQQIISIMKQCKRRVKVGSPQLSGAKPKSKIETRDKSIHSDHSACSEMHITDEGTQSQIRILDSCINKLPVKIK